MICPQKRPDLLKRVQGDYKEKGKGIRVSATRIKNRERLLKEVLVMSFCHRAKRFPGFVTIEESGHNNGWHKSHGLCELLD